MATEFRCGSWIGTGGYFATLLAKLPELAAIRLGDVQQQKRCLPGRPAGAIGLTLTRRPLRVRTGQRSCWGNRR